MLSVIPIWTENNRVAGVECKVFGQLLVTRWKSVGKHRKRRTVKLQDWDSVILSQIFTYYDYYNDYEYEYIYEYDFDYDYEYDYNYDFD